MKRFQSALSPLVCALLLAPAGAAQQVNYDKDARWIERPYTAYEVPPANFANSGRIEELLRAGRLYLSLQDVIALALENNLDIEVQRYSPRLAESDLLRASAGGSLRGVSTSVSSGSGGLSGQASAGASSSNSLTGGVTGSSSTGTSSSSGLSFDPAITGWYGWGHLTQPQSSAFIGGSTSVVSQTNVWNFAVSKGFISGATAQLGYKNSNISSNSARSDFNPYTSSSLGITITQPLLQGFGIALNTRNIRIARNNLRVADLNLRAQLIASLSNVIGLYWDLVGFNEDVRVKREALAVAERFYSDNKKQVAIGTMAPIEIVRAEAEVAARQQDLTISETNLLQQETILKNALSRTGVASASIADARVVPTDRIRIAEVEAVEPIQDLVARALAKRPEVEQNAIQVQNSKISLKGTRNSLLPSMDAYVNLNNNALAGQINSLPVSDVSGNLVPRNPGSVDPFFLGGYGTVLGQLFGRNFPDYTVGVQLNVPIRNRAAQANMIAAQLNLRQQEIRQQQAINQIRVEVQNALIALQQARARYQSAVKSRVLEEQTLDAVQKKFALGASTSFEVIQTQRDLASSQGLEVNALTGYSRARVQLDVATGVILEANNVSMDEASSGRVTRPPTPLPAVDAPPSGNGGAALPRPR
jgi:outer membrane protein